MNKLILTTILGVATALSGCISTPPQASQVASSTNLDPRTPNGQWARIKAEFNYWMPYAEAHPSVFTINKVISIDEEMIAYSYKYCGGAGVPACQESIRDFEGALAALERPRFVQYEPQPQDNSLERMRQQAQMDEIQNTQGAILNELQQRQ